MTQKKQRLDIHQAITDQIIEAVESRPGDPIMPWHRSGLSMMPNNIESGNHYSGINIVNLWVTAETRGFQSAIWGTYRQWRENGAQVRKGEKSSLVIFYKEYETEPDPEDENDNGTRRVARASYVFNADQVDGYETESLPEIPPLERIGRAEHFIQNTGSNIQEDGDMACYRDKTDTIHMPDEWRFRNPDTAGRTEDYYSVLLHELTHWTKPEKRCNRPNAKRFGDEIYAMEELVAELGAAFLCAELGISNTPREDHACYIANWLEALKKDKKAIFWAAARASEAVSFLNKLQTKKSKAA